MKPTCRPVKRLWQLKQATGALQAGGIIAYPTESVYGLGCDPENSVTVELLLLLKQRPGNKGLILIASSIEQLEPYIKSLDRSTLQKIEATWPGPVTWILPACKNIPPYLSREDNTIAVRVTAHPVAAALCAIADQALVSTSANISGHPPARTALQVRNIFKDKVDYIIHGATGGTGRPTEIRDASSGKILRSGN